MRTRLVTPLALLLGTALGACVAGDSALHLSERERADARGYLDTQLADGDWQLGAHRVHVDAHGWHFERDWDALRVVLVLGFGLAGAWLAWGLGRQPGPWRAARIGGPLAVGGGLALLLTSMPATEIDLDAGTATHRSGPLGWVSHETLALDRLHCRVRANRIENANGTSSEGSYSIVLEQHGALTVWALLETSDEALAHAVCERVDASLRSRESATIR